MTTSHGFKFDYMKLLTSQHFFACNITSYVTSLPYMWFEKRKWKPNDISHFMMPLSEYSKSPWSVSDIGTHDGNNDAWQGNIWCDIEKIQA